MAKSSKCKKKNQDKLAEAMRQNLLRRKEQQRKKQMIQDNKNEENIIN